MISCIEHSFLASQVQLTFVEVKGWLVLDVELGCFFITGVAHIYENTF